jgi:quinol-cytochrome oxidoreductase complex cytochrome b subunit
MGKNFSLASFTYSTIYKKLLHQTFMIILIVSENEAGLCDWPSNGSYCSKLWWVLIRPIAILLAATIPSCHSEFCKRFYMVTFFMCIVWIGVTSYMVSWMITIIGVQKSKILSSTVQCSLCYSVKTVSYSYLQI